MKKNYLFLFIFSFIITACSSSKSVVQKKSYKKLTKQDQVVVNALKYKGVRYRFGGTTRKGMDCSGVVYVAFGESNISLPRVSRDMAKRGKKIALKNAKKGDLVFFRTSKSNRKINHVGLVVSNKNGNLKFIHATTSKGVIISSIQQKYWKNTFVKATRIL